MPVQKKFSKPTRTGFGRTRPSKNLSSLTRGISFRALLIVFSVFLFSYGVFLLFKYTLFVPEYTITKIDYSLTNVETYDDPYFYKMISTLIKGENYRVVQWNESSVLQQLQAKYPFVESFTVTYKWPNRVFVRVSFDEPRLIVFQWNLRYAVYDHSFFQLFSGNRLWSGALRIELFPWLMPSLSTGSIISGAIHSGAVVTGVSLPAQRPVPWSLTGLFFQESFDHFVNNLQIIYDAFPNAKYYQYLVGGQRIVVWLPNDRQVYINLPVDISLQLQNYLYLKQYYADFSKLKEIDLWSIEMDKVIVRK